MPFIDSKDFTNGEFFKKLPVSAPIFQSPMLLGYFKTFWGGDANGGEGGHSFVLRKFLDFRNKDAQDIVSSCSGTCAAANKHVSLCISAHKYEGNLQV